MTWPDAFNGFCGTAMVPPMSRAEAPHLCERWVVAARWLGPADAAEKPAITRIRFAWGLVLGVCWQRDDYELTDCTPLRLRGPLDVMTRWAMPYLCRHDCELVANWMTRP